MFKNPLRIFILFSILSLVISAGLSAQITFNTQSSYRYLKGIDAAGLESNWFDPGFDDSMWSAEMAPFRFGDGVGGTELVDMQGNYSTLYLRSSFSASEVDLLDMLTIGVNWDDGFIIWINGKQVLSQQAPASVSYDALASDLHESGQPEIFSFPVADLGLVEGENSLAIFACNHSLTTSSDFYIDMSINARLELPELVDSLGLSFSHTSGFYEKNLSLTISSPVEDAEIIYTLDGSNPQNSFTAIEGLSPVNIPIDPVSTANRSLTPAVVVRASLVKAGLAPSLPAARTFIFLDEVKTQTYPGPSWPPHNTSNKNLQYMDYEMDPEVVNNGKICFPDR